MSCKYCYETNKKRQVMDYETIDKTIEFIENHVKNKDVHEFSVIIHGGEPLLEFDRIKYFISSLNSKISGVKYFITTNATLLNGK